MLYASGWAMALSLINHTRRGYRPKNSVIVRFKDKGWHTLPVTNPAEFEPGLMVYRFSHSMYYANTQVFSEEVTALVEQAKPKIRCFCIDASAIDDIDYSAGQALTSTFKFLKEREIRLVFVMVEPSVKLELDRYGVSQLIGEDAYFDSGHELQESFRRDTKTH